MQKMFPPYLDEGSMGLAVMYLQALLSALDLELPEGFRIDGKQTGPTTKAIKTLQRHMEYDPDGNFGPGTRARFKEAYGIDVDSIPMPVEGGSTLWFGPDNEGAREWPEAEEDEGDTPTGINVPPGHGCSI